VPGAETASAPEAPIPEPASAEAPPANPALGAETAGAPEALTPEPAAEGADRPLAGQTAESPAAEATQPPTAAVPPMARPPAPVPAATLPADQPLLIAPPEAAPPEAAPRPAVVAMPGASDAAVVRRGGEAVAALPPAAPGVTIRRPGTEPEAIEAAEPAPDSPPQPALRRHAALFAPAEGARPLGLVLIDAPQADSALVALPFAVTIALDPNDPTAPARARAYRAAGHEVALLAQGFPRLADASDVLVTLNAWAALFPETVALMDVPVNGLGAQRTLARDVAAMIAPQGLGAIALRDGVDAFLAAARAEDVPALALYRILEAESDIALRRMIDRAAFEAARRDGVVIAANAADPAVLAALAEPLRGGVVLAPVSALMP
jgi:hypothetical protein